MTCGKHYARIIDALCMHGPLIVSEMAQHTGLRERQCNRRTVEIQRVGLIRPTGNVRMGARGWRQREWAVTGHR